MATVGCGWADAGSARSASPEPRRSDAMAAAPRARWCCFVSAARTRPRPSLDWRRWAVAGQTLDPRDQRLPSLDAPTRWPPRLALVGVVLSAPLERGPARASIGDGGLLLGRRWIRGISVSRA